MSVSLKDMAKVYISSFFNHSCFLCHLPLSRKTAVFAPAPPHRLGTPTVSRSQADINRVICDHCFEDLPWLEQRSLCRCGLPIPSAHYPHHNACNACHCGSTINSEAGPGIHRIYPIFSYCYPIDQLINRYKHRHDFSLERVFEQCCAQALADMPIAAIDVLVPVPLHVIRYQQRGFNQSERLAKCISKLTGAPIIRALSQPPTLASLKRQQGLGRRQRQSNNGHEYRLKQSVSGLHVALVDDVVTTGATAQACSHALLSAGARQVSVICLARTLPGKAGSRSIRT
jgi:ComF family protein